MPYPEGPDCFDRAIELLEATQHALNQIPNQPLAQYQGIFSYLDYQDTYSLVKDIDEFFKHYRIPG